MPASPRLEGESFRQNWTEQKIPRTYWAEGDCPCLPSGDDEVPNNTVSSSKSSLKLGKSIPREYHCSQEIFSQAGRQSMTLGQLFMISCTGMAMNYWVPSNSSEQPQGRWHGFQAEDLIPLPKKCHRLLSDVFFSLGTWDIDMNLSY